MALYLLFEFSSGYALFERTESEAVVDQLESIQQDIMDFGKFKRLVQLKAFLPFTSAESALENCNDVSEGVLNDALANFLKTNFPSVKPGKSSKFTLGVSEEKLGSAIQEGTGISCQKTTMIQELIRGIRLHISKFIPELKELDLVKAQLGLGHSYSRAKVKFNVNKVDNMIVQSISLLDQLDKDTNTFAMRCREWYSWHFPELSKLVADQRTFARLAKFIRNKESLSEEQLESLTEITGDAEKSQEILEASRSSMGTDISEVDLVHIEKFADRVIDLAEYRDKLHSYLLNKMHAVAPNLATLVGEQVGARLIAHAGSLTNLSKLPASTVQILGAEKALFRALKTKSNTPKYGLIYHSSFIGRAGAKNKGRISRYLANKCAIAARIDNFSEITTNKFGEKMKEQVEERLRFYEDGVAPKKNIDVMREVIEEVKKDGLLAESSMEVETPKKDKKKKKKKNKGEEETPEEEEQVEEETPKKEKKKRAAEATPMETETPEKSKKKKKKKSKDE